MNIAILGFGTVGSGAYEAALRTGGAINVVKILARRPIPGLEALVTPEIYHIINDASIELVVEAMGGLEPAYDYVMQSLLAKKHVVSANKQLICTHYAALMRAALDNGVVLRFTAAAGGGIPWLFNLTRTKRCDEILEVSGIVNGTTNFILDAMQTSNATFADALSRAQALGYAEADPTADIDGHDAQRKCALSASLAFDAAVHEGAVLTEGIRHFNNAAARAITQLPETRGRVVKLLMRAGQTENGLYAYVSPALVRADSPEANVPSNHNLITLNARHTGVLSFFGEGAGKGPTGTSVVQDALDIMAGCAGSGAVHTRALPVANNACARDFFLFDGERTKLSRMFLPEMFGLAAARRAAGESLFFGELLP